MIKKITTRDAWTLSLTLIHKALAKTQKYTLSHSISAQNIFNFGSLPRGFLKSTFAIFIYKLGCFKQNLMNLDYWSPFVRVLQIFHFWKETGLKFK